MVLTSNKVFRFCIVFVFLLKQGIFSLSTNSQQNISNLTHDGEIIENVATYPTTSAFSGANKSSTNKTPYENSKLSGILKNSTQKSLISSNKISTKDARERLTTDGNEITNNTFDTKDEKCNDTLANCTSYSNETTKTKYDADQYDVYDDYEYGYDYEDHNFNDDDNDDDDDDDDYEEYKYDDNYVYGVEDYDDNEPTGYAKENEFEDDIEDKSCNDTLANCTSYSNDTCKDDYGWGLEYCPRYCKLCTELTALVTPVLNILRTKDGNRCVLKITCQVVRTEFDHHLRKLVHHDDNELTTDEYRVYIDRYTTVQKCGFVGHLTKHYLIAKHDWEVKVNETHFSTSYYFGGSRECLAGNYTCTMDGRTSNTVFLQLSDIPWCRLSPKAAGKRIINMCENNNTVSKDVCTANAKLIIEDKKKNIIFTSQDDSNWISLKSSNVRTQHGESKAVMSSERRLTPSKCFIFGVLMLTSTSVVAMKI